jgi:RNA-directed DNA polymerase
VQFEATVPTLEDKVAQRAILLLLEPIYETDFLPCSYGFRPGRSAHDALHGLRKGFMEMGLRWVVDVDISKYFDTIDHAQLRRFLDQRVTDGVVRRMIDKWLKAGVLEKGVLRRTTGGTPQGGVISPLLANIYLLCWTNGSRAWCDRGSKVDACWSDMPMMR